MPSSRKQRVTDALARLYRLIGDHIPGTARYPDLRTEHRSAEEALRESEARFRGAFDYAAIGMALTCPDTGSWMRVNRALCDMLGYTEAELIGRPFPSLTHPDDLPANLEITRRALAGEIDRCEMEKRLIRKGGEVMWVSMSASVVRDERGAPLYFIAQFQDISERRRAEAALRESETRFRALYERAAVGIGVTDADGHFLQANPAFCEILGYTEAELRERTSIGITHPDDRPMQRESLARLLAGELRSETLEKRYMRKDGSAVWVRATVSVIRDHGGAPPRLIGVIEDLSERKRAEAALRESETRFAHVAANVPGMVYQYAYRPDGTTRFTFVSEGARTMFGVAPEAALRDPAALLDLVHPEDRPQMLTLAREAADALGSFRWEGRVVLRSGEERFIQIAARDQRLSDGSIVSDGLVIDVTEPHRAARRLEESEQRYRSLFDHNPDAVFSLDTEGRFVSANPACELVTGYPPDELLGRSFVPFVVPEDVDTATAVFRTTVGGTATYNQVAIHHRSGHRVELGVTGLPIIIGGRVVGVFGIAKDLTATRALEQQLRQAQKMEAVGRLAGGVAHDFNNLLTVIRSFSGFAMEQLPEHAPARADLAEVCKAADRAAVLTRQLLAFSRQQVLKPRRLDLNATVSSLTGMLRRLIGEDIHVETELASAELSVLADPGQLEQVLVNLAVNARDAMPEGGTLRLRTEAVSVDEESVPERPGIVGGAYAALVVEDSGVGIEADALPKVFEPFYTTKGTGKGTGLGLATVYGIVRQSGGYVHAESTPGRGSRFTVLLPRVAWAPDAGTTASSAMVPPRGTETILLVEDDESVRSAIRRQLERQGYTVREAANGRDALALATSPAERIDLVLTDVVMPELSGRALVERLAVHRPELRAVYMSGYTDDEILRRGMAQPGSTFLEKPFTFERLADVVRRALDAPSDAERSSRAAAG
ncbi:MAG TPA: PAS domain S-box protein [Gemmatimonadaceae bacterium]|nr:PAS domain S-box protein [Gemmatimonadaceae bacterium]